MLKNIVYTTPLAGAIRLGHVKTTPSGVRLPQADDHFSVTSLYKENDAWAPHPLEAVLTKVQVPPKAKGKAKQAADKPHAAGAVPVASNAQKKLTEIPVRLLYNNPDLNASERHEAYDPVNKRVICAGNGATAKRLRADGSIEEVPCHGEACAFGQENRCAIFGRSLFKIEGQTDPFAAFILRTKSYHSVTTIRSKLVGLHAMFGNNTVGLPLKLVLFKRSTPSSFDQVFHYADLQLATGMDLFTAAQAAKEYTEKLTSHGLDQQAFETKMLELRNNGPFESVAEDAADREEFVLLGEEAGAQSETGDGANKIVATPQARSNRKDRPTSATALKNLDEVVTKAKSDASKGHPAP